MLKIIPENHCAHLIGYLRIYLMLQTMCREERDQSSFIRYQSII